MVSRWAEHFSILPNFASFLYFWWYSLHYFILIFVFPLSCSFIFLFSFPSSYLSCQRFLFFAFLFFFYLSGSLLSFSWHSTHFPAYNLSLMTSLLSSENTPSDPTGIYFSVSWWEHVGGGDEQKKWLHHKAFRKQLYSWSVVKMANGDEICETFLKALRSQTTLTVSF